MVELDHGHQRSGRHRRTDKRKLKCGLVLVADYLYFLRMGQSSKTKTTHSMVMYCMII